MDINKVWVSGLVISEPVLTKFPSGTPITTFMLQVNEQYTDKNSNRQLRPNIIKVESLGRSAEAVAKKVCQGKRYMVDGYIRMEHREDGDEFKIRTFAVYRDESNEAALYSEGIRQAISAVKKSRDLPAAIKKLEGLLASD